MSYIPMAEFEVTLRVHVPIHNPEPNEWDWPDLTDMIDEHIQFKSQRLVSTYNQDVDNVAIRTEVVDHSPHGPDPRDTVMRMAERVAWLEDELARVVPKSGMVQDLESPHSYWNQEGGA